MALALAPERTGLLDKCLVWVDSGGVRGTRSVAVALQEAVLDKFYLSLSEAKGRHTAMSVRPWWSEVLRHVVVRDSAIAAVSVQDCDSLTFLAGAGDSYGTVTTYSPINDPDMARSTLARALLSADVGAGQEVNGRLALGGVPADRLAKRVALAPLLELSR